MALHEQKKWLCSTSCSVESSDGESNELRRSKRSISKEWNLEIMIVADSKMKRYHGDNLEMYILTLMASVSLIFKDPSIGNNVNISIVKLIIMSEDEDADIIFPSASKTLRNFCRWQQELNAPEGFHHDTAILLTSPTKLPEGPRGPDTLA
ncbi:a disintegrin and metalloproteinase with thrombospondin motifs 9 [Caerostris extrusa]|uniref:A disintegrin and metalloproteinase with thrombospondin motifs 9 n=1 Tax=Caerostris extrusa TaxID=172846 RepID=A0AAV4XBX7_CAEEX|nr:a disintegrin and metalloproteinase with thrombospondin motifs 9 [Caerostris extrusa]